MRASFPGFRLRLTRWGGMYLVGMLLLALAAANTGNNALVMLLGLVMGSFVLSGAWSQQVLGMVRVTVRPPREAYAGSAALTDLEIENGSRLFPAYGLVVRDGAGEAIVFEPLVPAGDRSHHAAEIRFPSRGWHEVGPYRLEVTLPLGFFLKGKRVAGSRKILVYPRLLPRLSEQLRSRDGGERLEATDVRGREGEVHQLRPFHDGDEKRQIHWKQTARQQRLIAVDREPPVSDPLYVVLDPRSPTPDDPAVRARFEELVSRAATIVVTRLKKGLPVGLVVGSRVFEPARRADRIGSFLRPLAEVELSGTDAQAPKVPRATRRIDLRPAPVDR